jgi:hypothetical protein
MTGNNPCQKNTRKNAAISAIAALFLLIFSQKSRKNAQKLQKKHDFPTSTQRIGANFTERIRDVFRHTWLKKH